MPTKRHVDSVLKQADDIIREQINKYAPMAGLSVGIVHKGELVYTFNWGYADIARRTPVTSDTVFRIMSISKTFTAVGLMQLWQQGKFQLDDPINDHLKVIRVEHPDPNAPPVTIRHMLTHTSGVGELHRLHNVLKPEMLVLSDLSVKDGETVPPLNEFYADGLKAELYPGTKWSYCNHAFGVLGQLIADLSGQPFEAYMIEHVFKPLGMNDSDWFRSDLVSDRLAVGYEFENNSLKPVDYLHVITAGASNIYSSVSDMAHYVAAIMNGGSSKHGTMLKPDTLETMMSPHFQLDPRQPNAMGLGFLIRRMGSHRIVRHGGGWPGFISDMMVAPDDKLALLVFTNTSNPAPGYISSDLMRRLLDVPDPVTQLPRPGLIEQPHYWSGLVGRYGPSGGINTNFRQWSGLSAELEVTVENNRLTLRSPDGMLKGGTRLYAVDADDPLVYEAVVNDNVTTFIFKRNEAGYVDRLVYDSFTYYKKNVSPNAPLLQAPEMLLDAVHRQGARVVFWYFQGMPNKLKAAQYVLTRLGILLLVLLALGGGNRRKK